MFHKSSRRHIQTGRHRTPAEGHFLAWHLSGRIKYELGTIMPEGNFLSCKLRVNTPVFWRIMGPGLNFVPSMDVCYMITYIKVLGERRFQFKMFTTLTLKCCRMTHITHTRPLIKDWQSGSHCLTWLYSLACVHLPSCVTAQESLFHTRNWRSE